MSTTHPFKDRNFLAVIGDEVCPPFESADSQDSVTGLLLAGIGHITQDQKKNFKSSGGGMNDAIALRI